MRLRMLPFVYSIVALAFGVGLTSCAAPEWARHAAPLDTPQASLSTVQTLRRAELLSVSLAPFSVPKVIAVVQGEAIIAELPLAADAGAIHLHDTLWAQLKGADLYDASAKWVLSGTVVHVDMGKDHGTVAARFVVRQPNGSVAYERQLRASSTWAPALGSVGARIVATEQAEVYQKLAAELFGDPAFQQALRR